jgi:hypothetical protein
VRGTAQTEGGIQPCPAYAAWLMFILPRSLWPRCRVVGAKIKPMHPSLMDSRAPALCELRFQSLFNAGYSYAFPCDAAGKVDLDSLSDKARENYFYARTLIGREFANPTVANARS